PSAWPSSCEPFRSPPAKYPRSVFGPQLFAPDTMMVAGTTRDRPLVSREIVLGHHLGDVFSPFLRTRKTRREVFQIIRVEESAWESRSWWIRTPSWKIACPTNHQKALSDHGQHGYPSRTNPDHNDRYRAGSRPGCRACGAAGLSEARPQPA